LIDAVDIRVDNGEFVLIVIIPRVHHVSYVLVVAKGACDADFGEQLGNDGGTNVDGVCEYCGR
jgi:hypothetical protein